VILHLYVAAVIDFETEGVNNLPTVPFVDGIDREIIIM